MKKSIVTTILFTTIFLLTTMSLGEDLVIDQNGNVGIGTATPNERLDLVSSSGAGGIRIERTGVRAWGINIDNSPDILRFRDYTSGTIPMVIAGGTGNVGLRTSNPQANLQIYGNGTIAELLVGEGKDIARGLLITKDGTSPYNANIYWSHHPSSGYGDLYFHSSKVSGPLVTFKPSGNVGIGTTDPLGRLHIKGGYLYFDDYEDNILFDGGQVRITTHDGYGHFQIKQGADNDDKYVGQCNGAVKLQFHESGDFRIYSAPAGSLGSTISWNLGLTQIPNGYVGIGTASPTAKLEVVGVIKANELQCPVGPWSDFVFDDDYQLRPIEQVESYVKDNKHLPDIPSAEELKKTGISLTDMLSKQMQKIEELTLYVIQLQKKNQELEARLVSVEQGK